MRYRELDDLVLAAIPCRLFFDSKLYFYEEGTLDRDVVSRNRATYGGGVYAYKGGALTNCVVHQNWSGFYGAGVYFYRGGVVECSSIADNSAPPGQDRWRRVRQFGRAASEHDRVLQCRGHRTELHRHRPDLRQLLHHAVSGHRQRDR